MNSEPDSKGLVELFTGNGKGKTSAALGVVLRAVGQGLRVHIIYFMKGDYPYGERNALTYLPNVSFQSFGHLHFIDPEDVKEDEREQAREALRAARQAIGSGDFDLVVLDEINIAAAWKLIDVDDVVRLIEAKPDSVEIILTGRRADDRLVEKADLVTEMVEIKHPFRQGIEARKGFDY
jgi:cob(I)alamin adenosyltransferase